MNPDLGFLPKFQLITLQLSRPHQFTLSIYLKDIHKMKHARMKSDSFIKEMLIGHDNRKAHPDKIKSVLIEGHFIQIKD